MCHRRFGWIILITVVLTSVSCIKPPPVVDTRLYSLNQKGIIENPSKPKSSLILGVRAFECSSSIESRMLYRTSPVQIGYYEFERWAEPPGEMLTQAFVGALTDSGLFQMAVREEHYPVSAFSRIVSGRLERFEEDHTTMPSTALCVCEIEIYDPQKDKLVFKKSYSAREPLEEDNAENFARSMNKAVKRLMQEFIRDIENSVSSEQ